jgi:hypothetical protein
MAELAGKFVIELEYRQNLAESPGGDARAMNCATLAGIKAPERARKPVQSDPQELIPTD